MVQDGIDGLLYPHTEIQTLAEKIQQLTSDHSLSRSLGRNARETALERHDPANIARLTRDMYQEVIASEGIQ